jgi:hypothetical protein
MEDHDRSTPVQAISAVASVDAAAELDQGRLKDHAAASPSPAPTTITAVAVDASAA